MSADRPTSATTLTRSAPKRRRWRLQSATTASSKAIGGISLCGRWCLPCSRSGRSVTIPVCKPAGALIADGRIDGNERGLLVHVRVSDGWLSARLLRLGYGGG